MWIIIKSPVYTRRNQREVSSRADRKRKKEKKLELEPKREYIDSQDHWLLGLTTGGTDDTVNKVYVHQDGRKRRGTAFNPPVVVSITPLYSSSLSSKLGNL
jgi:hypothetical protein